MITEKKNKNSSKGILTGLALGAVAGALAGILLAPKSGKALRRDLQRISHKIAKEVAKKVEEAGEMTKEKYHQLVEETSDIYRRAKEIKDKDVNDIVDDLKSRWPKVSKKLKK